MTSEHPLLPHSRTDHAAEVIQCLHRRFSLRDTIEHCIADFGWTQMVQAILISFTWFFDAQQTFISVFTDAQPKWSCNNSSSTFDNSQPSCDKTSNLCQLSKDDWSWDLPVRTSIVSEWSLECAGSITRGLPASSFFLGSLIGGFALATLADTTVGRKNMLVISSLIMSLAGVLTAVSNNVWTYVGLRFVSGFGRTTVGTCALVLSAELVGTRWRGNVGILGFICFTLGFLSLPVIAFLLRDCSWRLIYLWTCVPSVLYSFLVYFVVRESPRWLFVKGRKVEFAETLRSISSPTNRSCLTESFFSRCDDECEEKSEETDMYSAMKILVQKKWAFNRLAAVMAVGFGIGMIYYGMPLGLGSLSFDLYLSVVLNALSEFPASILTFLLIGKVNRKSWLVGMTLCSGTCSLLTCVLETWKGMQLALELLSFFSGCTACDLLLIYTLELFPTCVRNSAVSTVRLAVVLGGVFSPVLVANGSRWKGLLSYGVFGVNVSVCGLFVVCLPETRGRTLSDTMEEEELAQEYCIQ